MKIEFDKAEKEKITAKLRDYLSEELNIDLGRFDAEFLLDFFLENIGGYFYNKGLEDARLILGKKIDDISDDIAAREIPMD